MLAWTGCRLSETLAVMPAGLDPAGAIAVRSLKKRDRTLIRETPVPDVLSEAVSRCRNTLACPRKVALPNACL